MSRLGVDYFDSVFAVDCIAARTVNHLFGCDLVTRFTCISNWYRGIVSVVCPSVTLCGWQNAETQ